MSEVQTSVQETLDLDPRERLANSYALFDKALLSEHAVPTHKRRDFVGNNGTVTTEESTVDVVAWDAKRYEVRLIRTQLDSGEPTETYIVRVLNPSEHTDLDGTVYGIKYEFGKGSPYVREKITADIDGKKVQERLYDDEENIKRITALFDGLVPVADIINPNS